MFPSFCPWRIEQESTFRGNGKERGNNTYFFKTFLDGFDGMYRTVPRSIQIGLGPFFSHLKLDSMMTVFRGRERNKRRMIISYFSFQGKQMYLCSSEQFVFEDPRSFLLKPFPNFVKLLFLGKTGYSRYFILFIHFILFRIRVVGQRQM